MGFKFLCLERSGQAEASGTCLEAGEVGATLAVGQYPVLTHANETEVVKAVFFVS